MRRRVLLVIPIRLGLGVFWFAAAAVAGAGTAAAALGFAVGVLGAAISGLADPRSRLVHGRVEPLPLPDDARIDSLLRHAWSAMLPSTAVVSVLAAVALVPQPVLAAILGGISAGLGVAALVSLPALLGGPELFVDGRGAAYSRE